MSPWIETSIEEGETSRLKDAVARIRATCDVLVVQMHWGVPHGWAPAFQGPLAQYQHPLAHALIDAGADLIVGHHPHIIHGVEHHGRGVVAYSLGD